MGLVLKRMMLRAADRVSGKLKAEAMITGESMAQVSSQTLTNLGVIDKVTDRLVLRPLITYDKQDIINIATKIGAYEFAASMPEYCAVISNRPAVRAKLKWVEKEEQNFNFNVLEEALNNARVTRIDKVLEDIKQLGQFLPKQQLLANDVVVDVRPSLEQQKKPLNLPGIDIITVPFFKINKQFATFDQGRNYLLYCEKGVVSQLHALHIQDQGFKNVGVYRPQS